MKRLIKFVRSPFSFKILLAEAFVRLFAVSVLLRFTPRSRVSRYLTRRMQTPASLPNAILIQDICRAIVTATRYVAGATCLVQCIVCRAMLGGVGCAAEIEIGVSKNSSDLQAHAWLESEGLVLIGGPVTQYTRLAPRSRLPKPEVR
jgi:hypothetical protein